VLLLDCKCARWDCKCAVHLHTRHWIVETAVTNKHSAKFWMSIVQGGYGKPDYRSKWDLNPEKRPIAVWQSCDRTSVGDETNKRLRNHADCGLSLVHAVKSRVHARARGIALKRGACALMATTQLKLLLPLSYSSHHISFVLPDSQQSYVEYIPNSHRQPGHSTQYAGSRAVKLATSRL
jgi:hypothetical protein